MKLLKAKLEHLLIVISIAFLFGAVGEMSFDDELDSDIQYCKMVAADFWPAYRKDVNCDLINDQRK